jgi:hypothetical protein
MVRSGRTARAIRSPFIRLKMPTMTELSECSNHRANVETGVNMRGVLISL